MPTNHDETLQERYAREAREIEARAPVCPEFGAVAKRKLNDLQAQGYTVIGYMLARAEADYTVTRGAIDIGGMVIWWSPKSAAQAAQPKAGQEPVHWRAVLAPEQVPHQLNPSMHVVGIREKQAAEAFVEEQETFYGWRYTLEPLYTSPQQRDPMTDQEILEAFESDPDLECLWATSSVFEAGVRYAEKRLGIQQHGSQSNG